MNGIPYQLWCISAWQIQFIIFKENRNRANTLEKQ